MIARAISKHVRVTPRKARFVVETLVGLTVPKALTLLQFTHRGAAEHVERALKSAVSNARQAGAEPQELVVSRALATDGPTWKRFRAGAMGRAMPILKRTCHITIELDARPGKPSAAPVPQQKQRGSHGS